MSSVDYLVLTPSGNPSVPTVTNTSQHPFPYNHPENSSGTAVLVQVVWSATVHF
jgi:hypothetical protein